MATSMATNIVADGFTSKSRLKNAKVCREMFSQCFICHVVLFYSFILFGFEYALNSWILFRFFRSKTRRNAEHLRKDPQPKQASENFTKEVIFLSLWSTIQKATKLHGRSNWRSSTIIIIYRCSLMVCEKPSTLTSSLRGKASMIC